MEIIYRPYYKKSGKSFKICDYFRIDGHGGFVQKYEVYDHIRRGYELVFDLEKVTEKKYYEHFKKHFSEQKYLFSIVETQKEKEDKDVEFLNRIIRNGGFSQYAYYLEDRIAKQQVQPNKYV